LAFLPPSLTRVSNIHPGLVIGGQVNTTGDIQWDDAGKLLLRAERDGGGGGRTYTITVTATDASGNSATESVTVSVPKSQGKKK
ncbi:MAG: hypothetical protein QF357_08640, partial [Dehalococcoidia bacterium]|nr:hypothetical protein [Dehalococcoidia bacterium]